MGKISADVYYIQRVRFLDRKPLILDTNIFLKSLVPGLTAEIVERSIYAYVEKELGMQIVTSKRTITVEHISAQDEQLLELGNYNCLAVVSSQMFNSDGVMFEYTQSRHQPDHFSFHDTATRKKR
ncbi:MAG: UTRA domain-containing protein [Oscillospiraceae bacterium]|nr:UTRA domain-containing protein [Oscillospiraceae bacterium]